jgi:predicted 2-oxoglutarate/Fe(II)-dependent dioxygenase YbiX
MLFKIKFHDHEKFKDLVDKNLVSIKSERLNLNTTLRSTSINSEQWEFNKDNQGLFFELANNVKYKVADFFAKTPDFFEIKTFWVVKGKENSFHSIHQHSKTPTGYSVVLYLDVPPYDQLESVFDERGLFYWIDYEDQILSTHAIKPERGDLLIFRNNLLHGTTPQLKGTRTTFNVDLIEVK